jgi:predicted RNA-binding protein (virulence factor B family)
MNIGEYNELTLLRFTSVGAYLGDDQDNDVLLPIKYLTDDLSIGDLINVFLYKDSEDRIVATTETPKVVLNSFAFLKVKEVNAFGAFLDWGLEKDLLVPFKEMNLKMEEDRYYPVFLKLDEATNRLVATARINNLFAKEIEDDIVLNEPVDMLIWDTTELGVKVIVNNKYSGLIYHSDITRDINRGFHTTGYVYNIREDGKLDVRLEPSGYEKIEPQAEKLLAMLHKNQGVLMLTDKSDPDDIRAEVGMSKKTFKQAVGNLYKNKIITLEADRITLVND